MVFLALIVPWLLLVTVACALIGGTAYFMTTRAAKRARTTLERLGGEGDAVMLRGRLRVDGDGAEGGWRGRKRLAATSPIHSRRRLWPSDERIADTGTRCARLWLDTKDGPVLLEGALAVEAGSRQRLKGLVASDQAGKWFGAEYAVFDGDDVVVAGERTAAPVTGAPVGSDYRKQAGHEMLTPLPRTHAISVFAFKRRAWLPVTQLLRHPIAVLAALGAVVPSCRCAKHYDEVEQGCDQTCEAGGECGVGLISGESWSWSDTFDGDVFRCVASDEEDCKRADVCRIRGACGIVDRSCAPANDDHCRYDDVCLTLGKCSAVDGNCVATRDEDCRRTDACADSGRCSARDGGCVVGSDADCAGSYYCKALGHCRKVGDECKAATDDDCRNAESCVSLGQCSARSGNCVLGSDEDCRRRWACAEHGECTFDDRQGCVVAGDEDCIGTEGCAKWASCHAEDGKCVASSNCRSSAACRVYGRCEGNDSCRARSDEDCQQSERCQQDGACSKIGDGCAKSCADTSSCRESGLCSERKGGGCHAASDADCRQSNGCRKQGHCTASSSGYCVAGKAEDCRRSAACREMGQCTREGENCIAAGNDCDATRHCQRAGLCEPQGGYCRDGRTEERCGKRPVCKELGRCTWQSYECVVGSDKDCSDSEVCRRFGWCHKVENSCFLAR